MNYFQPHDKNLNSEKTIIIPEFNCICKLSSANFFIWPYDTQNRHLRAVKYTSFVLCA